MALAMAIAVMAVAAVRTTVAAVTTTPGAGMAMANADGRQMTTRLEVALADEARREPDALAEIPDFAVRVLEAVAEAQVLHPRARRDGHSRRERVCVASIRRQERPTLVTPCATTSSRRSSYGARTSISERVAMRGTPSMKRTRHSAG